MTSIVATLEPAGLAGASAAGYRSVRRRARLISIALVAPLLVFILLTFVVPLCGMFFYAVNNPEVRTALPRTTAVLAGWTTGVMPPGESFRALAADLRDAPETYQIGEAGRRLNYEIPGFRSTLLKSVRAVRSSAPDEFWDAAAFARVDEHWRDPAAWHAIRRAGSAFTPYYLLAALDLRQSDDGGIRLAVEEDRVFAATLARTFWIAFVVTVVCLLLGYPLANIMATASPRWSGLLLAGVLLPFWTSLLVRTTAWVVILQKEGMLNGALQALGLVDAPLELIFNRTGVYIAMVHITIPFTVLPLYSVMKGISPSFMRASSSLGATPLRSFWRIYLPLTMPGIGAGCLLTFIITSGYYITPALVGGARDQMISYYIAFFTNTTINWGMSAALGIVLLSCILILYVATGRIIGVNRIAGLD